MEKVKFAAKNKSEMLCIMKQKIDEYFKNHHTTQFANAAMKFKIILWLSLWAISIVALYTTRGNPWLTLAIGFGHMLTHVMIAFNIAHDANHGAISPNAKVNRLLSYSLDLIGVSSELWRYNHNQQHHTFVNIEGHDNSVEGYKIFKFCPAAPYYPWHKYQHIYAPIIYSISTLNYVTTKDFKLLKEYTETKGGKEAKQSGFVSRFIAWKVFYYAYVIFIPIFLFKLSALAVIGYFVLGHVLNGALLAFIFQTGHLTIGTSYPEVKNNIVEKNWAVHIVETTGDYGPKSFLLQWLCGAINIHVIHHLFPRICHTHYRRLVPIIKDAVREAGYEYKEFPSFYNALTSHLHELKILGSPEFEAQRQTQLVAERQMMSEQQMAS
jgi:linoleoyl-CoA desaturase